MQSLQENGLLEFINQIIDAKGLPGIDSQEVRQYVVEDMIARLSELIDRALISALPEEKAGELGSLLDNEATTPEEVQQFIIDAGVDVPRVTALTMIQFKDLYLQELAQG